MRHPHRTRTGVAAPVRCGVPVGRSARPGWSLPALPVVVLAAILTVWVGGLLTVAWLPTADGATLPVLRTSSAAVVDPEAPPPRRVSVERLGIDSALVGLKVLPDGTLDVPADFGVAGWHRAGTAPGDIGPAVVVGHVDSFDGPAVFYRLRELQPGDRITVARVDGSLVDFEVYGSETVAKDAFPTERVYGATDRPELRLVTCGGRFDQDARSYTDNVVVYARVVEEPVPS